MSLVTPPESTLAPAESTDANSRSQALRGSLERLLLAVMDTTALLRLEVSCPLVLDGPVVAERPAGHALSDSGPATLLVRRLPIPPTDRLPASVLLMVATDPAALEQAQTLPIVLSQLLDAHLARLTAEAAALGAMELANRDSATGLGNRRAWMHTLKVERARAGRTERPLTVLILDLDGLKTINDRYGHAAGDRLIARTALALRRAARTTDQVCRLGGDEFGVAAPDTDVMQAQLLAARLRSCLHDEGLQVSMGWAVSTSQISPDNLWQLADASMYDDKRSRRLIGSAISQPRRPDSEER